MENRPDDLLQCWMIRPVIQTRPYKLCTQYQNTLVSNQLLSKYFNALKLAFIKILKPTFIFTYSACQIFIPLSSLMYACLH